MASTETDWPRHDWRTGPHDWGYRDGMGNWRCSGCGIRAMGLTLAKGKNPGMGEA